MSYLYVHIPFCTHRCGYCDFVATEDLSQKKTYIEALLIEAQLQKAHFDIDGQGLETLYIGGGTPSALNVNELEVLLSGLQAAFGVPRVEYTIEMNPETVTEPKIKLLTRFGVNRVSLGMQAKQQRLLQVLERRSDFNQVARAVALIKGQGIKHISLDVLYGIPGQTMDDLKVSLEAAIALGPDHISCYALKLEPDTPMGRLALEGRLAMPEDDFVADQLDFIVAKLVSEGYSRYEISNFALPGGESNHNRAYWTGVPTLGLGAGAVYLQSGVRYKNYSHLEAYLEAINEGVLPIESEEILTPKDLAIEMLLLRLRLKEGLSLASYLEVTGVNLEVVCAQALVRLKAEGLIATRENFIYLTDRGMALENSVLLELIKNLP